MAPTQAGTRAVSGPGASPGEVRSFPGISPGTTCASLNKSFVLSHRRFSAVSMHTGSTSMPRLFLPQAAAAIRVVRFP